VADLILTGAAVFDGTRRLTAQALVITEGAVAAVVPEAEAPAGPRLALNGGTLAPGLIDLQVNGGGGAMLNGTAPDQIATICAAHGRLGTTGLMPTLITDTPAATEAVIAAGITATDRVPGFLGLHLEGPHLDPTRPGCHPPGLIRAMTDDDLALYLHAARALPALIITLAPASVRADQIAALAQAGVVVCLGHSECSHAEAQAAQLAGARGVTHLFNAMSQLTGREPGLVGAALTLPFAAGLIADGIHVHPANLRLALAAKPGGLFLVSDAMAVAGTGMTEFPLAGRRILRRDGALRLENGTLAGADLSLPQAIRYLIAELGVAPETALAMATSRPAALIGARAGRIAPGLPADLVHFDADWHLTGIWQGGVAVQAN
jgi:N-acetylglucosamine-6-phosphate deacetylase